MHRLAFQATAAIVVSLVAIDLIRGHLPDPGRLSPPAPEPPRRVVVAIYYNAAGDLLTFREPRPGRASWTVVRLDEPAGATMDEAGAVLKLGTDTWTASQCLLLAHRDHPSGFRLAPPDDRGGSPMEAGLRAGMPLPDLPGGSADPVAVYYDTGADRLTFRRPGAAQPGDPVAWLTIPDGSRVTAADDRLVIGPDARTATESWLRAWRGEAPDLRLAARHGREAPRLAPGVLPASRRPSEPVFGEAGGGVALIGRPPILGR